MNDSDIVVWHKTFERHLNEVKGSAYQARSLEGHSIVYLEKTLRQAREIELAARAVVDTLDRCNKLAENGLHDNVPLREEEKKYEEAIDRLREVLG